jgi:uncharacterized protein (DUF433 family)
MPIQTSLITSQPGVCGGRPCIRSTRVRDRDILDLLAAGASFDEILEDYPYLERAGMTAALLFAADHVDHTILRVAA